MLRPARTPAAGASDDDAARQSAERQIEQLAGLIQRFKIDAQRFFAGDLPMPPDDLRDRITTMIRRLRGANLQGAAASFRLGSLEAQFNSHLELFGRRLRERELGGARRVAEAPAPRHDPDRGVVIGPRSEPGAAEALYKGLYLRSGTRDPQMGLEQFRSYLGRQAEAIRAKTGCEEIQFRVAVEDGKMKLKAKPIRSQS